MWERDRVRRIATVTNDPARWSDYKKLKNRVNHFIKHSKKNYYHAFFDDNLGNVKATWNGINSILSRKKSMTQTTKVIVGDKEIIDPVEVSNAFNVHFTDIGPNLASKIDMSHRNFDDYMSQCDSSFELKSLTVGEVLKLIRDLPSGKADGLDGIPARLLKLSTPLTAVSLTHIFNRVIETGSIPNDWKNARVTPIHKDNSKLDPVNYRPISVLSVIAKVFEKAVFNQTYQYLVDNNILAKFQSGFRPLHSTLTALLDATNNWYLNIDNGLINAILFIDLKKAFDTIDHEILLKKLEWCGLRAKTLQLFRNYLLQRTQLTVVNGVKSKANIIRCGVPQGSILGPLLFLLYINDLPNCNLLSKPKMYADDTNLTYAAKNQDELVSAMNRDLVHLKQWLSANKLSLNVLKTKCMFIGTRQKVSSIPSQPNISLDGQHIDRVTNYKCLGVELDETLTWNVHMSKVTGQVTKVLGALRRLKPLLPQHILISIYKSLILPHFDYCSAVWGNCGKGLSRTQT